MLSMSISIVSTESIGAVGAGAIIGAIGAGGSGPDGCWILFWSDVSGFVAKGLSNSMDNGWSIARSSSSE